MTERVTLNVPGQQTFHIGTVTGYKDFGDVTFDVVTTYCGLEIIRTPNTSGGSMKGWGYCPACVRTENEKNAPPVPKRRRPE